MDKIARFEKVSLFQFKRDLLKTNPLFATQLENIYQDIILPTRATIGSAGYDFKAPFDIELKPNEVITIPTGIRCFIKDGWVLTIFPRSGLGFKYRLQLNNTVGIIDADYYGSDNEGHILIRLANDSKDNKTLSIKKGEGFVQGIFLPFGIVEDDSAINKRNGGFGSTNS